MLSMCRLFADDNSLQYSSKNIAEMECSINQDLNTLDKWSKQWLLQFNPNKTKAVFFTLKKNLNPPQLIFQQCPLEYVTALTHRNYTI